MKMEEMEEPCFAVLLPESRGAPKFKSRCEGPCSRALFRRSQRTLSLVRLCLCSPPPKVGWPRGSIPVPHPKATEVSEALAKDRGCTLTLG